MKGTHWLAILSLAALAAGCGGGGNELYPLKVGNHWSYTVNNGFASYVQNVQVTREVPVAGGKGFEVSSGMGVSRMGWKGSVLYATMLPNSRFPTSPLPLLVANDPKASRTWNGQIESAGAILPAQATLHQSTESLNVNSRKVDATKVVVTLRLPKSTVIELETYYAKGIGVVMQKQRTNGKLDVGLEYLSGP